MHHLFIGLAALAAAQGGGAEANNADMEAVRAAVLDYVESVYQMQPERVTRSVSPDLVKVGYHYQRDGSGIWPMMNFTQLRDLAANYNRQGRVPANAPKEIQVLDVQPHIANAKLKAAWGIDYLLLAKGPDGRWQIRQVMWEGNPPATPSK
jgi:ketosteroid isomerase-like protein